MSSSLCTNDNSIGPSVQGCRGDFDFTITFERIFLAIIPASIFVALSIPRIAFLFQKPRIVGALWLQVLKLVIITIYATLQFSLLILLTTIDDGTIDGLAIASAALSFVAGLSMTALSHAEHTRAPRPSMLLNSYVLLTLLFDIVQTRTSWLVADSFRNAIFARIFTASVAVKVLLLLVESQRKTKWLRWNAEEHSPEETSGIFSLGVFFWLNKLFLNGYRKVLAIPDLYPLDKGMASEAMEDRLSRQWSSGRYKGKKYGLAKALAKALIVPILMPIAPRVALIGFNFSQPFFINTLLNYLQDADASRNAGYGLIGACALIYTGIAVATAFYQYYSQRMLYMARGSLAASVYKKTTEARIGGGDAAAVTLMSTDVERIVRGFTMFHEFWANVVEVALGSWLLQRQLGLAFLAPIVVILVCVGITTYVGTLTGPRQRAWMDKIQKRVGLTANVINNMKNLRISGISSPVFNFIQSLRVDEINTGAAFRMLQVIIATVSYTPLAISPVIAYAVTSATLDVSTMYTALSYLILVTTPLSILFQAVPGLIAAFACLDRIQEFLDAEERVDFRRIGDGLNEDNKKVASEKTCPSSMAFTKPSSLEKQLEAVVVQDDVAKVPEAIRIVDGSFGWTAEKMTLTDINAHVPASKLTIVVGPVASGKSTLCKVLLGEVPFASGQVVLSAAHSSIAYCEQSPFLSNSTLKENIIGYSVFSQTKYDEIIDATMLSLDVTLLPSGHDTAIGSNGIMLSGGQKQRVSLARALYAESELLVFDDILSGLDNDTATEVFRRVFGPDGLLRKRNATTVLCTHSVRYLPSADHIIALSSEGNIVEEGTFDDLMKNGKYVHGLGVKATDSDSGSEKETAPTEKPAARPPAAKGNRELVTALDDRARQTGDWRVYQHYFSRIGNRYIAMFIFFAVLWAICHNVPTIWMGYWAQDTLHRPTAFYIGIFALFRAIQLAALMISATVVFIGFIAGSGTELHANALATVVSAPLRFFTTTDSGVVTNLFSQDMTLIDTELPMALCNIGLDGFDVLGMAAVIAVASPFMALSYPVLFFVMYMLQKFYLRTSRQIRLLDLEAKSPLYTHFLDTIKGVATIRAFGWTSNDIERNNRLLDTSQRPAYLLAMIQQWLGLALQIMVLGIAIVLTSLATQLRTNSGFTGASLVTLMSFGEAVTVIIRMYTLLETSIGAVARLKTFSEKVATEDLPGEDVEPPEEWPQNGQIEIKDVSASYTSDSRPSSGDNDAPNGSSSNLALKNLTISIQPGEKVAICGRTGSGKSSLILLLLRLLDPLPSSLQNITIDGLAFHRLHRATLRQRIIAVPQDAVFLPDGSSVKANLDPFDVATDEECLSVLEVVQLSQFVTDRGGLQGDMAADDLSAGQKQLFSLGRAILRRRVRGRTLVGEKSHGGILLLDEVSSSVDQNTDRMMQEIIKVEFGEYTIVMVSHRLDMVVDYFDKVVVMDRGSVVEMGKPRELIEREGSRFGELWMMGNHGK